MPSSLFDVLCVLSSAANIAKRSASIQAARLARPSRPPASIASSHQHVPHVTSSNDDGHYTATSSSTSTTTFSRIDTATTIIGENIAPPAKNLTHVPDVARTITAGGKPLTSRNNFQPENPVFTRASLSSAESNLAPAPPVLEENLRQQTIQPEALELKESQVVLKPSRVPSSRLARLFHYGGLAAGLGVGAASEYIRRSGGGDGSGSLLLSEGNISRLVDKLSRMRGAALKLGQFLSIQDAHVLPPQLESVFQQLQNKADYMPNWQMEQVMASELGNDWRSKFEDFNPIPVASASIGQVHTARLAGNGMSLAVKIQFPNVAQSITSDLSNLSVLLTTSSLLPRGLFLQNTINAMQQELADECDYEREAHYMQEFARHLQDDDSFRVPKVISSLTTKRVLIMEWMEGVPLTRAVHYEQRTKNEIASRVLKLCLRELFEFSMMQTDPNWTNFLWNPSDRKIELIDFGATREYSKSFIDQWLRLLRSAISNDREECLQASRAVGYLTGEETEEMVAAHLESMFLLSLPFRASSSQPYQFSGQTITTQIRSLVPVMLRQRLTPPPRETYSLNRMLSGAFLLCARLGAEVDCNQIWHETTDSYRYTTI